MTNIMRIATLISLWNLRQDFNHWAVSLPISMGKGNLVNNHF